MGKKRFINKKKAATFVLECRETFDAEDDTSARVFTRVDGGTNHVPGFSEDDPATSSYPNYGDGDEDASVFADAEEDESGGDGEDDEDSRSRKPRSQGAGALPDHIRVELVELGFPDDGYDYLQHMRKIGTAGVGGDFVPASRPNPGKVATDVKVYDSSKVPVQPAVEEDEKQIIEAVGSSTKALRRPAYVEEGLDAEVAAALANSDDSQFDSADELEDDFVVFANDNVGEEYTADRDVVDSRGETSKSLAEEEDEDEDEEEYSDDEEEEETCSTMAPESHQQRPTRLLDEQFENLALREYDDFDDEFPEEDVEARGHADISQFEDVLTEFMKDTNVFGDKYMTPAEISKKQGVSTSSLSKTSESRHKEVPASGEAEKSDEDDLVVLEVESDDERSNWDCETVVSTLSNLDNHPGRISAPSKPRQKAPSLGKVLEEKEMKGGIIRLRGKQHLPTDFLPAKPGADKIVKKTKSADAEPVPKGGPRAGETPEQRKARKTAVKEERREARASKKALKVRYKDETQRAQHGAAHTGPSGIHLP